MYISKKEDEKSIYPFLKQIKPGSHIYTDSLSSYNFIEKEGFIHKTVNHRKEFSTVDNVNNNLAENFNSRIDHNFSIYKHVSNKYLFLYALETAYRANHNKDSLGQKLMDLTTLCFQHPKVEEFTRSANGKLKSIFKEKLLP